MARKPDRRIQRTRRLLWDAFRALIEEKGYGAVSVQDIIVRADVARTTFYLHFKDKDDLLTYGLRAHYEQFQAARDDQASTDSAASPAEAVVSSTEFHHFGEYAALYRMLFSDQGSATFMAWLRSMFAQNYREQLSALIEPNPPASFPLELCAYQLAGAKMAAIVWWLNNDQPLSPEKMADLSDQFGLRGAAWALGFTL